MNIKLLKETHKNYIADITLTQSISQCLKYVHYVHSRIIPKILIIIIINYNKNEFHIHKSI